MVKVTYNPTVGLVQKPGSGIVLDGNISVENIAIKGSTTYNPTTISTTTELTSASSFNYIFLDASTIEFTTTLPTALEVTGRTFRLVKSDSSTNAITISAMLGETIMGLPSILLLSQYETATLTSHDGSWWVLDTTSLTINSNAAATSRRFTMLGIGL